jgi:hypothetical protein
MDKVKTIEYLYRAVSPFPKRRVRRTAITTEQAANTGSVPAENFHIGHARNPQ